MRLTTKATMPALPEVDALREEAPKSGAFFYAEMAIGV